jgi:uncharacterized protein YacL
MRLFGKRTLAVIAPVYFGLFLGFVFGHFFWLALEPLCGAYLEKLGPGSIAITRMFLIAVSGFVCVGTLLMARDEYRFFLPAWPGSRRPKSPRPLVLDTNVIIDGRISDICETSLIDAPLVVPNFVLQKLQTIAKSPDRIKRSRGQRGLDVLKRIQSNSKVELRMHENNLTDSRDVQSIDERLVSLARYLGARVVTNDCNLNKICHLQGVEAINLNTLASALKPTALPGELLAVDLVKPGDQLGQGVGYLEDGTMVVVDQGRYAIGQKVMIAVTRVLQTPAGRMIFGKIDSGARPDNVLPQRPRQVHGFEHQEDSCAEQANLACPAEA